MITTVENIFELLLDIQRPMTKPSATRLKANPTTRDAMISFIGWDKTATGNLMKLAQKTNKATMASKKIKNGENHEHLLEATTPASLESRMKKPVITAKQRAHIRL